LGKCKYSKLLEIEGLGTTRLTELLSIVLGELKSTRNNIEQELDRRVKLMSERIIMRQRRIEELEKQIKGSEHFTRMNLAEAKVKTITEAINKLNDLI